MEKTDPRRPDARTDTQISAEMDELEDAMRALEQRLGAAADQEPAYAAASLQWVYDEAEMRRRHYPARHRGQPPRAR
jgi:hypothetical protein